MRLCTDGTRDVATSKRVVSVLETYYPGQFTCRDSEPAGKLTKHIPAGSLVGWKSSSMQNLLSGLEYAEGNSPTFKDLQFGPRAKPLVKLRYVIDVRTAWGKRVLLAIPK